MASTVFIYTLNRLNSPGTWSRYVFPFAVDAFTTLNDVLYIRSGDDVLRADPNATQDYAGDPRAQAFPGIVQWGWLDMGSVSITKMMHAFDITSIGTPSVSFGYDESNPAALTTAYAVPPDSIPGMMVPMPLMAPSMSVQVNYASAPWKLYGLNLWMADQRPET